MLLVYPNCPISFTYLDDLKLYADSRTELKSLVNTVRIISSSIGMEFGLNRCTTVSIEHGKFVSGEDIALPTNEEISTLDMSKAYKYLGVWESNDIKHDLVKSSDLYL